MVEAPAGEAQARLDVVGLEIRQLGQHLVGRQSGREEVQDIAHTDSHAADARTTTALFRIDGDAIGQLWHEEARLWELRLDGCRGLACIGDGACRLVSRHGHTYGSFDALRNGLTSELRVKDAMLDGEIVCLDAEERSLFKPLRGARES